MVIRRISYGTLSSAQAATAARLILDYFDSYARGFRVLTCRARRRFEECQWRLSRHDALRRMNLYEKTLVALHRVLRPSLGARISDLDFWADIKSEFAELMRDRADIDIVETFFNSVTRKILQTVGINREIEFFRLDPRPIPVTEHKSVYNRFETRGAGTASVIHRILQSYSFSVAYEDIDRDAEYIANELDLYIWPLVGEGSLDHIDMISVPFFRNRVAYLVGRLVKDATIIPIILPLYNDTRGIYADAALFRERQASIIFGFAHTSFCVDVVNHISLIEFLKSILPRKPVAELYISIGFNKHGKTEFYRDLHHFIHESHHRLSIAPGQEGSVMIGFTMRDFRFILKVVKDRPCFLRSYHRPVKIVSRQEVMERYRNVRHQDHVGRLVDTQEFENLRFKRKRFTSTLLREFRLAAKDAVTIEEDNVTIHHCYLQRRVVPLPMYIASEPDPEAVRTVILDFGYFLKDLASVGIFPTDLFNIWNCGVTSRRRVVLFDYDDVTSLRYIHFRAKPQPRSEWEELQIEQDRIAAGPNDFFIDEMERYLGIPRPLMGAFRRIHGDLFNLDFWHEMQHRIGRGEVVNIIPYDRSRRFEDRPIPYRDLVISNDSVR